MVLTKDIWPLEMVVPTALVKSINELIWKSLIAFSVPGSIVHAGGSSAQNKELMLYCLFVWLFDT